jgi:hypothetical protein
LKFFVSAKLNGSTPGTQFANAPAQQMKMRRLAPTGGVAYAFNAVKQPFVNVEEKIDRFVGRRTETPDAWKAGMQLQATAVQLHKSFKHRWMPKGVYRFKTHEEADAWMTRMLARSDLSKT